MRLSFWPELTRLRAKACRLGYRSMRFGGRRPDRPSSLGLNAVRRWTCGSSPRATVISVFRFRAEPERLSASRPCAVGAAEFRHGAAAGGRLLLRIEDIDADALPAGVRGGDLRGPRLARRRMGGAGAPAVRAFRRIPQGAARARSAAADLSELREPLRSDADGQRPRVARALAARSGRRAALSRHGARDGGSRTGGAARAGRALRHPPRHEFRDGMGGPAALERRRAPAQAAKPARSQPIPRRGATSSSAARTRRPAIIFPSWSTTRCKASPMWCAARICSGRPACTGCCRSCWALPPPVYHHHRLILDAEGRKLAKSTQSTGLRELRAAGHDAATISAGWLGLPS